MQIHATNYVGQRGMMKGWEGEEEQRGKIKFCCKSTYCSQQTNQRCSGYKTNK